MDTSTMIATSIALISSLIVMGLALRQNAQLQRENLWLRKRNRELREQMERMAPLPW